MAKSAGRIACAIGGATCLAVFSGTTAVALMRAAVIRRRRKQLAGKVVLITGGSRGFGLALAREFASLDCRLALCTRDPDELERAQRQFGACGK